MARYRQQNKIRRELRERIRNEGSLSGFGSPTGFDSAPELSPKGADHDNEGRRCADLVASSSDLSVEDKRGQCSDGRKKHDKNTCRRGKRHKQKQGRETRNEQDRSDDNPDCVGEAYLDEGDKKDHLLYRRAWVVLLVIGLVFLSLGAISYLQRNPGPLQVGAQGMIEGLTFFEDSSTEGIEVEDEKAWQEPYINDLPEGYQEEIGLGESGSLLVSKGGQTIGYSYDGSLSKTMESIRAHLEERGWTYVPSGQESAATFAKDAGVYRWLAVTCAYFEGETSVVLVLEKAPEEGGGQ